MTYDIDDVFEDCGVIARKAGVSRATIERMVRSGSLPAKRVPDEASHRDRWLVSFSAIDIIHDFQRDGRPLL